MDVKVIVDGRTVFEEQRVTDVHFEYPVEYGLHIVHLIIANPPFSGQERILVTGQLRLDP